MMTDAELARFTAKYRVADDGCWVWTGTLTGPGYRSGGGYGSMKFRGTHQRAHRLSYEHFVGPIADGLQIDHLCRNRQCVNPAHLEAVTARENLLRGNTITARNAAATQCPRGHEFAGDNLYVDPRGHRQCRACRREALRQFRARQAVAA